MCNDTFLDCTTVFNDVSSSFKRNANASAKCAGTVILSCGGFAHRRHSVWIALLLQALPLVLLSSVILVLWIWLTGGLHLDGLADTADAWVGGFGDKARTLEIMKDPSCGPIGVLSLVIVCILKWSALYVLLQKQCYSSAHLISCLRASCAAIFLFKHRLCAC